MDILSKIPNSSIIEGSFISDLVSPIALSFENCYKEFDKIIDFNFLTTMTGSFLDIKASECGITRKDGTKSTGLIQFTGEYGTNIPKNTIISSSTGLAFFTTEDIVILNGTETVIAIASDIGVKFNLPANTINTLSSSIIGLISVTNTIETLGGTEIESDDDLTNRILEFYRKPATSGNIHHYKLWATEVFGVSDAKVFPLWNGPGTVKVLPITTEKRSPSAEIITNVFNHIELNRPIGANVTVIAPIETKININAKIEIASNSNITFITSEFKRLLEDYLKKSINNSNIVDFYKTISFFYDIDGVVTVNSYLINGLAQSFSIPTDAIQVIGEIIIGDNNA